MGERDAPQRWAGFTDPLCLRFSWPGTAPPALADVVEATRRDEEERLAGRSLTLGITDAGDPETLWGNISLYDVDLGNRRRRRVTGSLRRPAGAASPPGRCACSPPGPSDGSPWPAWS